MLQFLMHQQKQIGQSAYRKVHSTEESVLLKVENNIAIHLDKDRVTALTLLNLSEAFDTIDLTLH